MWIEHYLNALAASPLFTVYSSSLLCAGLVFTTIAAVLHARRMLWLYWSQGQVSKSTDTPFRKVLGAFGAQRYLVKYRSGREWPVTLWVSDKFKYGATTRGNARRYKTSALAYDKVSALSREGVFAEVEEVLEGYHLYVRGGILFMGLPVLDFWMLNHPTSLLLVAACVGGVAAILKGGRAIYSLSQAVEEVKAYSKEK